MKIALNSTSPQTYTLDLFLSQEWQDLRLAYNSTAANVKVKYQCLSQNLSELLFVHVNLRQYNNFLYSNAKKVKEQ